jgi:hypothetical protein
MHNTIFPYWYLLFEKLAKKVKLTVYYCSIKLAMRNNALRDTDSLNYKLIGVSKTSVR